MSYRIVYGPEQKIPTRKDHRSLRIRLFSVLFLLLFMLAVKKYWPEGQSKLAELLLPGNPGVTQLALEDMVSDLGSGVPISDAFTAFCHQILLHE